MIHLLVFAVGGIVGMILMGLTNINKLDAKVLAYKLRTNIISKLTYYKNCWEHLAEKDNLYMLGKIEAMDMAIKIVKAEFDKSEVEGE